MAERGKATVPLTTRKPWISTFRLVRIMAMWMGFTRVRVGSNACLREWVFVSSGGFPPSTLKLSGAGLLATGTVDSGANSEATYWGAIFFPLPYGISLKLPISDFVLSLINCFALFTELVPLLR